MDLDALANGWVGRMDVGNNVNPERSKNSRAVSIWEFPKIRVPYFGVLIIRILLFRVLY